MDLRFIPVLGLNRAGWQGTITPEGHEVSHDGGNGVTRQGVTWLGFSINTGLAAGKIVSGILFGSQIILADGLHSMSDLVTDVMVLAGIRVADRPADANHQYGHRRVTTLVTALVGISLFAAAAWIAWSAIATLRRPHGVVRAAVPLVMALISIPLKEFLYRVTRVVGVRERDSSLVANAWHHRTDAFTSVAAAAGLAGVLIGGPAWAFLDHVVAIVLAAFLAVVAVSIMRESLEELVDSAPPGEVTNRIDKCIAGTPGVRAHHAMRARKLGGRVAVDVHVLVDPTISIQHGHDIAEAVIARVLECGCDVLDIVVHIEPDEPAQRLVD